jgi:hypothetical protein
MQDSGIADCKNAKNLNSNNEEGFLRVQKIKSRLDYFLNGNDDLFLTVRQPTDLYNNNSSYPIELRTERPLKYETVGPHELCPLQSFGVLTSITDWSTRFSRPKGDIV